MNIITVTNSQYMPFAEVFFDSLKKISDYEKIKKVYVIDTGMNRSEWNRLTELCDKVVICQTHTSVPNAALHTGEWREVVGMKLKSMIRVIKILPDILPLCMIDIDSYFHKNFLDKIESEVDFVVCKRTNPVINNDNYELTHIGSFFCLNNVSSRRFLEKWIDEMERIQGDHIETPALCNLLRDIETKTSLTGENKYTIQHAEQDVVSAVNFTDKCCIFHLKSDGPGIGSSIDYRINKLKQHV